MSLWHTFNIGSYNKQKQLESVVENLEIDQIITEKKDENLTAHQRIF